MTLSTVICASLVAFSSVQLGRTCGPIGTVRSNTTQVDNDLLYTLAVAGALQGGEYCQHLFRNEKWKCPWEVYRKLTIFDNTSVVNATRETAFMYAISSAAITHGITYQCRLRNVIPACPCGEIAEKKQNDTDDVQWGGCSDNIKFGGKETRRFLNNLDKENDTRAAVNRHNNQVGIKVVQTSLQKKCDWQTCWKVLAPFEHVASKLKQKYHNAVRVWFVDNKLQERVNNHFRNVTVSTEEQKLVYLDSSLYHDYSAQNDDEGSSEGL